MAGADVAGLLRRIERTLRNGSSGHGRRVPPAFPGPCEMVHTDVGPLWVPAGMSSLANHVKHRRRWDEGAAHLLRILLRPGQRFLDAGAGPGYLSILASRLGAASITTTEARPRLAALCELNLWSNHVVAGLHRVILSDEERPLGVEDGSERAAVPREGVEYSVVLPGVPADRLFPGERFDVVRLDAAGNEAAALGGMGQIVAASPGISLIVPFRHGEPVESLGSFRRQGFDILVLQDSQLTRMDDSEVADVCERSGPGAVVDLLLQRTY